MADRFGENVVLWDTLLWTLVVAPVLIHFYRKETSLHRNRVPDLRCGFWLFVAGAVCSVMCRLAFSMLGTGGYEEETRALFSGNRLLQFIVLLVASPLWEELFFRGILFARLKNRFSVGRAAVISALCFGLYHGNLSDGIYAFLMGIFLAAAMERHRTVAAPIAVHMGANTAALVLELVK